MRVGVVASPWVPIPPPAYGGTEAVIDGLVRGLAATGHEVVLFAHPDSEVPGEVVSPLPAEEIGPIGDAPSELAHVLKAYELAQAAGVDVIHDHTQVGALAADRPLDLPVVVTNHGPFDRAARMVFRAMARDASVVAISRAQAASAGDVPIASVVHHGIDLDEWPCGRGDGGYVLFLGRMHPTKGADRAIRLARAAGVPIVLAAKLREAAEQEYFDREVQPRLGADARFVGEVGGAEKRELLGGAAALLNPIAWPEPFGMVMIEAMACGTPVVACPRGAAPEIVAGGVTGYLCTTDDDFAAALGSLDGLDRGACRTRVARRFSVEAMANGYLDVYERALAGRTAIAV